MSSAPIILDLILVAMLAATIVYAVILNGQIIRLRDSRAELAELIRGLNDATALAESSVKGMRRTATDTGEDLQRAITKATALRDELKFMIETGETLADRLGSAASTDRPRSSSKAIVPHPLIDDTLIAARAEASGQATAISPPTDSARARDNQDGMSRAERELMQAIENRR